MSYDLKPHNKELDWFRFGAFSFPVLLEACGYLFPCIQNGGQWYCAFGIDKRMPEGSQYPGLISNDGFHITSFEAKVMARCAKNFVAIQRILPEENKTEDMRSKSTFKKEDVLNALLRGMSGGKENWPVKIRSDFVNRFEEFAGWAEKSQGFSIH